MIRRDRIQILTSRELRRLPKRFDPAATGDPRAFPGLTDTGFYFRQKRFERIRAFKIQAHLALADSENVAMRVGQSRNDCVTMEIDSLRCVKFLGSLV